MTRQSIARLWVAAWLVIGVASGDASAQEASSGCTLVSAGTGVMAAVIDGRSFRLEDGREIRLAGLEVPLMARAGETSSAPAAAAKAALEDLLRGRRVILKAATVNVPKDRYGRYVAHVFTEDAQHPLQYALLARGQARLSPRLDPPGCRASFLEQEGLARKARLGLWSDPRYGIRPADRPEAIAAQAGHFAVVEGKVISVRGSGATIYLNFSRRWSEGFAVTIRKRDERAFAAAGLTPQSLEGRVVRVRGWIEDRGAPRIEAAQPEQIEIAERD